MKLKLITQFVRLCALLSTPSLLAQESPVLNETRTRYETRIREIQEQAHEQKTELKKSYLAALLKQESAARREKDLDRVLSIRSEIERVEPQDPVRVFDGASAEHLAPLQEILNRQIETLDRNRDRELREFGQRVLQYGKSLQDSALTAGQIEEAVAWRDWLQDVQDHLPDAPVEPEKNLPAIPSIGIPHTLVIWNSNNSGTGLHGSDTVTIKVLYKGKTVAQENGLRLNWDKSRNLKTEYTFQVPAFDEILIEIDKWKEQGAALSEIELFKGKNTSVEISRFEVSSVLKEKYPAEALGDGIITPEIPFQGYWIAKTLEKSWVRLFIKAP